MPRLAKASSTTSRAGLLPGETRWAVIIREHYLAQIKARAHRRGETIRGILEEALAAYFDHDPEEIPETTEGLQAPPQEQERGEDTMPRKLTEDITVYTVDELAEMLKVTQQTLRGYIRTGKLRGQKVAGEWLVTAEALRDFLEGRK